MKTYMSIDVEAAGLFGAPFAVGIVIVDQQGNELEDHYLACPLDEDHPEQDIRWVQENVLPALPAIRAGCPQYCNCEDLPELLQRFWAEWQRAKAQYEELVLVTDCPFPVEAGFLLRVANEMSLTIEDSWYPVIDVASALAGAGYNPLADLPREPAELPMHNPVNDARQSVRVYLELQREIKGDRTLAWAHGFHRDPDEPVEPINCTITYTEPIDGVEPITVTVGTWTPPEDPEVNHVEPRHRRIVLSLNDGHYYDEKGTVYVPVPPKATGDESDE